MDFTDRPTDRNQDLIVCAELDERVGVHRAQRYAIGTEIDERTGAGKPAGETIGIPRAQGAVAVEHDGQVYVEPGMVVLHPNTRVRYGGDQKGISPSSGLSFVFVQLADRDGPEINPTGRAGTSARDALGQIGDRIAAGRAANIAGGGSGRIEAGSRTETITGPAASGSGVPASYFERPVGLGPANNLFRVIDGHLCLIGSDPQEHSPADPVYRAGGGFMAFKRAEAGPGFHRTRVGDALAPMRLGPPTMMSPSAGDVAISPTPPSDPPSRGPIETIAREAVTLIQEAIEALQRPFTRAADALLGPVEPGGGFSD